MDRRQAKESAGDRVYQAIKARVIAYEFPPEQRIYLEPIADELGVSTTPVREALNRLAAEDLVIKAPRKGFLGMRLSKDKLLGHYELTRLLLVHELESLDIAARDRLPEFEPVARVLFRLNRRVLSDVNTLAAYTGELFAAIASLGENEHVMLSIRRCNDHLHYIRTLECRHLEHVQSELTLMCELLLAGQCEELSRTIQSYHETRIALLPKLLEFAGR